MKYVITAIIIGIIILAWCPWLSADEAMKIVDTQAALLQKQYPNLCAMSIQKETIRKTLFGYTEEVLYDCTTSDPIYGVLKSDDTVFVSFYKQLFGMRARTVIKSL